MMRRDVGLMVYIYRLKGVWCHE